MGESVFPPPRDLSKPFDPPPEILRRQKEEPISKVKIWNGADAWLITRYEHGLAILSDDRFSANPWRPGFPEKSVAYAETLGKDRNIRSLDKPEHPIQKRMVMADFTVRRVNNLRPKIQAIVDGLIDDMLAAPQPVDLVESFSLPVPTKIICLLLGVPFDDHEYFGSRSKACMAASTAEEARAAGEELNNYIDRLISRKINEPGDDFISRLVHEQLLPGHLSRELVVSLGRLMLAAGHETTANGITMSVLALLQNPDQLELLRNNDDPNFIANAVDELMRYLSVVHTGRRRVAIADVEIGGVTIKAGEGVIILNSVMDRDENVFRDPHRLDLQRENARLNITFGYGIHQCPGQYLSRVEMRVVHETLWKRIPNLKVAIPFKDIEFFEGGSVYSIPRLPVTW